MTSCQSRDGKVHLGVNSHQDQRKELNVPEKYKIHITVWHNTSCFHHIMLPAIFCSVSTMHSAISDIWPFTLTISFIIRFVSTNKVTWRTSDDKSRNLQQKKMYIMKARVFKWIQYIDGEYTDSLNVIMI